MYRSSTGGKVVDLLAKNGYALGAIDVRHTKSGDLSYVVAVRAIFMRVKNRRLSPGDSYASPWVGRPDQQAQPTGGVVGITAEKRYPRVVGICGNMDGRKCSSLGLVLASGGPEPKWLNEFTGRTIPHTKNP